MNNINLTNLRKKIDIIDEKIASLFNERMKIVKEVGIEKAKTKAPILNKNRENEVIEKISSMVNEEIKPYAVTLFETIMEVSRDYQVK